MAIIRTTGRAGFGTSEADEVYGYNPTRGEGNINDYLFGFAADSLGLYNLDNLDIYSLTADQLIRRYVETASAVEDGRDFIAGGVGDDFLFGGAGDDFLTGGPDSFPNLEGFEGPNTGNDVLFGGWGSDRLAGGNAVNTSARDGFPGRDVLIGGPDYDLLFGNRGRDVFLFRTGDSLIGDRIQDLNIGLVQSLRFDLDPTFADNANLDHVRIVDAQGVASKFIGSAQFTHSNVAEVRYFWTEMEDRKTTRIEIDSDGNGTRNEFIDIDGFYILKQDAQGLYGISQTVSETLAPNGPVVLYLNFDQPAPSLVSISALDQTVTRDWDAVKTGALSPLSTLKDGPQTISQVLNIQSEIVRLTQDIFDRSGIPILITTTNSTTLKSVQQTMVQFSQSDLKMSEGFVGYYFSKDSKVDQFNLRKDGEVVGVFQDQNSHPNLFEIANTIAHEAAHSYGAKHTNPLDGDDPTNPNEPKNSEVSDYQDGRFEEFHDGLGPVIESPYDKNHVPKNQSRTVDEKTTTNEKLHVLAYALNYDVSLVASALNLPIGTYETQKIAQIDSTVRLSLPTDVVIYDALLIGPDPIARNGALTALVRLGDLVDGSELSFQIDAGSAFHIIGFDSNDATEATYAFGGGTAANSDFLFSSIEEFEAASVIFRLDGDTARETIGSFNTVTSISTLALGGPVSLAEGDDGSTTFNFTVTRSGDLTGPAEVAYAVTGDGSDPASPGDFANGLLPSGTVRFAPDETSKTITVEVVGDTVFEASERFTLTLLDASDGVEIAAPTTIGTIENDDPEPSDPTGPVAGPGQRLVTGTAADDTLRGSAEQDLFFFDLAAEAAGRDAVRGFGADDLFISTRRLFDRDGDGVVGFGGNKRLDFGSGDGAASFFDEAGRRIKRLEFDGVVAEDGMEYFIYSRVGSAAGLDDLGFG